MAMYKSLIIKIFCLFCLVLVSGARAEPIYYEKFYPKGTGPFPAVIALHTSGGFRTVKHLIKRYVDEGFAVYAPDFFIKHGLTPRTRMQTFNEYRKDIERELSEIVKLMKNDPKIERENVFATGFSNGGFWVCYLAGTAQVSAGVSHYGVWKANFGREWENEYPMKYFSSKSSPILALHGEEDGTQRIRYAEQAWDDIQVMEGKLEFHVYPEAGHAWDRKNHFKYLYNEDVDKDSHKRTIDFFRKFMK